MDTLDCDKKLLSAIDKTDKLLRFHKNNINKFIRDSGGRMNVINTVLQLVTDNEISDKFDTDAHLLGFNNGVFDLNAFLEN